ncbi:zinc ribbon domain-containing protein [Pseudonocardia acidicola]|uniref:Zinc ribbon domain-containing protein n=1 Tax=Pseudonocardia acidicola TaxID=2724939 RepID=A0ABX1SK04_9PSEU|nr:zinc ribbon domain-containing protein [Pseudonocardia acidicola]NMI01310.1 zinc ribbon domain-containing protein [Pseudonocardia acidicola]
MATYRYRCAQDGVVDVRRPIGTAPATWPCPRCAEDMPRVFTAPMLSFAPRAQINAIDRAEATAGEPSVVTALPPRPASRRTPMAPPDPALRRLPRP